jgi:Lon protease-like protein
LRTVLALAAEAGDATAPATIELSPDPVLAGHQMSAVAPLGSLDQQALLAAATPEARLDHLARLLDEVDQVLRMRLAE